MGCAVGVGGILVGNEVLAFAPTLRQACSREPFEAAGAGTGVRLTMGSAGSGEQLRREAAGGVGLPRRRRPGRGPS